MATHENVAPAASDGRELSVSRLTQIDGIARKTAEAIYDIGIHGYEDLAQYLSQHTAQQVSAALKEHGVNRPPAFIDQATWVKQATELGGLDNAPSAALKEGRTPGEVPKDAQPRPGVPGHDAVFTVSFDVATDGDLKPVLRTTVLGGTNGDQEQVFQGSDTALWVNWIVDRAHLPVAVQGIATATGAVTSPIPVESSGSRLAITDVQVSLIGPTSSFPAKRLRAEISFQLSGAGAETLASKGIPFRTEGYTMDIESGLSDLVASERGQLVPHVLKYVSRQEFGIPDLGHYEFYSIVLLLPPGETAAYHRGPTMRVVP